MEEKKYKIQSIDHPGGHVRLLRLLQVDLRWPQQGNKNHWDAPKLGPLPWAMHWLHRLDRRAPGAPAEPAFSLNQESGQLGVVGSVIISAPWRWRQKGLQFQTRLSPKTTSENISPNLPEKHNCSAG